MAVHGSRIASPRGLQRSPKGQHWTMTSERESSWILRLAYKPFGVIAGIVGGLIAGAVFRRLWSLGREGEAPKATDADRGWTEVVLSAAAQGAVFGAVKSAVDRAGAEGFAWATGAWPGRRSKKSV
jgi:Protein of unknown function (DUF4235)